jgi:hypothetical protein
MTREDFDNLAIFVAVAEELRREPFFSEDNHDHLSGYKDKFCATFSHPVFLKSAILPFRKIWMPTERCAFRKHDGTGGIRDLVFLHHPNRALVEGNRYWFYTHFEAELQKPGRNGFVQECNQDIIDIWINTQVAHTGKKVGKNRIGKFELKDFDEWATRIGREKFEFLFRTSLQTFGSLYINFAETLAIPLFKKLQLENGMVPGFEAEVALKYNPYPDPRFNIIFDDFFWHLDRESLEETFDRLLTRQKFQNLKHLMQGLFPNKSEAIAVICEFVNMDEMFKGYNVAIQEGETQANWDQFRVGGSGFNVFAGPAVHFLPNTDSRIKLNDAYSQFRIVFFDERKRQPNRQKPNCNW